jgi:membrane protease YdiL (CAAX protease family)
VTTQQSELSTPLKTHTQRVRSWWELAIVLGLSFGASGVYATVAIIERVTRSESLASQSATIAHSLADRPGFDLTYQLLGIATAFIPVALVMWLVWRAEWPHLALIGLNRSGARQTLRHVGGGALLAAAIGVPGLLFYVAMKAFGLNTTVVPTALDEHWWTVPILLLTALRAAVTEEIIVVAYLFHKLRQLAVPTWGIILASALLRGSYHLYQGFGGAVGNVVMGLVFGWVYARTRNTMVLIVAHLLLDIVSFVGYPFAVALWPDVFSAA